MFEINEYIVYAENGVCVVDDICTPPISGVDKNKKYYVLHPLFSKGCKIYTPVENEKVVMRKILLKKEAMELIDHIPAIENIEVANERFREDYYKKAMRSFSGQEWIKVIKTLYNRKEERKVDGKALTATDERYLRMAEECLHGELSISLGIPKEQVEDYIDKRVRKLETMEPSDSETSDQKLLLNIQ